jgi:hypothetical protein
MGSWMRRAIFSCIESFKFSREHSGRRQRFYADARLRLAGVVEDDLPAAVCFLEDEREDACGVSASGGAAG